MLKKYRVVVLIILVFILEALIYFWAAWSTEDVTFIFAKAARNSGRASALLNLLILFSLGYYGLKQIYDNDKKRELFKYAITLYAVNHLIHFYYIFQNFKSQLKPLEFEHNEHGAITFAFILLFPFIIWSFKHINKVLYYGVVLHIINTTYFTIISFDSKIKPEDPAYLHQVGIGLMIALIFYAIYRVFMEKSSTFIFQK